MMTFRVSLKKPKKPMQSRLRFDIEKLKNKDVAGTFKHQKEGNFAPLINLRNDDTDVDSMITTYNTAVTNTGSQIPVLEKERRRKKPWVTRASEILEKERCRKKIPGNKRCS